MGLLIFGLILCGGCDNPFAPNIDNSPENNNSGISDQSDIEGIFKNLSYAYTFKDTLIYGKLLHSDFTFSYRDYDLGYDISWGRQEEMRITQNLFQNSEQLTLVWNKTLSDSVKGSSAQIIRGFNLTVIFNPSDVLRIDGRVNLLLDSSNGKWTIVKWNDESNF